jgi:DNA-binding GntR family transcriptional regulator
LHGLAAEMATAAVQVEHIDQLKSINAQFADAIEQGQPYQAMELDEQFHNLIIEISDNPYVSTFSLSLQMHIRRFKYLFLKQPVAATLASVQEHDAIIDAMENGEREQASELMKQNLLRPMRELYALIYINEE